MNSIVKPDRRSFLVGAAALSGFTLGFRVPESADAAELPPEVNAWVVVKPDDTVVIRIARAEIGQGLRTGLAQLTAEELGCDWAKVTTEFPTPGQNVARKRVWGAMNASGSQGIRNSQDYVRKGGAAARMMLVQAAANGWNVPAAECTVDKGVITHKASGQQTTFGAVAEAAGKLEAPKDVVLKDPKDWTIAGKPLARLDTHDKVNGTQIYGIDVKLPGMLLAALRACPVQGGKVKSFDATTAKTMRGVKDVVQVGDDAVAVVADNFWNAKSAVAAVQIVWDGGEGANVSSESIAAMLKAGLDADEAYVGNKSGDAKAALAKAPKVIEAVYSYPFQYHATMEPMNATALYTPDKCEVWCSTQNAEAALAVATAAAGLPIGKCEIYMTTVAGGGFGRRGRADYVAQAVLIAKQMPGTPVKLIWTREEDFTHCTYHPATQCKMKGALDADGNLVALHMRISGQSILASMAPERMDKGMDPLVFQGLTATAAEGMFGYNVPNILIDHAMRNTHLLAGFWRGVNANHNSIYVESFIDELAHASGQNPLAFRRKMAKPKLLAVLNAVAERGGYDGKPKGDVHQGLCAFHTFGSYVAACADVTVSKEGHLKIHRIVAATDPGYVVNPAMVERQIAGSFAMGLTSLLYGECTVKAGAVEQTNFDTYNIMRLEDFPKVEAILMPSGGFWGGVGEPTIAAAAPAVLNAIFAATGKRIRSVPLLKQNLAV